MPTLQLADLWRESGPLRRLWPEDAAHHRPGTSVNCCTADHEEMIPRFPRYRQIVQDLPLNLYQHPVKFRDEQRRVGVMRAGANS